MRYLQADGHHPSHIGLGQQCTGWKAARRRADQRYAEAFDRRCPPAFEPCARVRVHDLGHMSTTALFDVVVSALFDGVPGSRSGVL